MSELQIQNMVEEKLIQKSEAKEKISWLTALEAQLIDCWLFIRSLERKLENKDLSEWARKIISIRLDMTKDRYKTLYHLIQCERWI